MSTVHIHFFSSEIVVYFQWVSLVCLILHMKVNFLICVYSVKKLFADDIIGFAKSALADIAPTYLIQKLELKSSIVRACVGVLVYVVRIILRRYNWVPLLRLLYLSLYCVCMLVLFSVNSLKTIFRH